MYENLNKNAHVHQRWSRKSWKLICSLSIASCFFGRNVVAVITFSFHLQQYVAIAAEITHDNYLRNLSDFIIWLHCVAYLNLIQFHGHLKRDTAPCHNQQFSVRFFFWRFLPLFWVAIALTVTCELTYTKSRINRVTYQRELTHAWRERRRKKAVHTMDKLSHHHRSMKV